MLVLGLGAGLAGCEGEAKPSPLPEPSSSAASPSSSSPSASEAAAPSLPAAAEGVTPASAKAFVRHWVDVLNYSGPAGDSKSLRSLATSKCVDCDAIADFIDAVASNDGSISGNGWTARNVRILGKPSEDSVTLDALVTVHAQRVTEKAGAKPKFYPGGKRLKTFYLVAEGRQWRMRAIDQGAE